MTEIIASWLFVIFNSLNALDKITTYIALKLGFVELNSITVSMVDSYGLLSTMLVQFFIGFIASLSIYLIYIYALADFSNMKNLGWLS